MQSTNIDDNLVPEIFDTVMQTHQGFLLNFHLITSTLQVEGALAEAKFWPTVKKPHARRALFSEKLDVDLSFYNIVFIGKKLGLEADSKNIVAGLGLY